MVIFLIIVKVDTSGIRSKFIQFTHSTTVYRVPVLYQIPVGHWMKGGA